MRVPDTHRAAERVERDCLFAESVRDAALVPAGRPRSTDSGLAELIPKHARELAVGALLEVLLLREVRLLDERGGLARPHVDPDRVSRRIRSRSTE